MFRLITSPIVRTLFTSLTRSYKPSRKGPPTGKTPIFQPFAPGKDYYNSADQPKEELGEYLKVPSQSLKKTPFSDSKSAETL